MQEWDKLWSTNKRIIDPVCPRHVAVKSEGRVKLRLNNGPTQPEVVSVPKHKKNPDVGVKATTRTKVPIRVSLELVQNFPRAHVDQQTWSLECVA